MHVFVEANGSKPPLLQCQLFVIRTNIIFWAFTHMTSNRLKKVALFIKQTPIKSALSTLQYTESPSLLLVTLTSNSLPSLLLGGCPPNHLRILHDLTIHHQTMPGLRAQLLVIWALGRVDLFGHFAPTMLGKKTVSHENAF